MAGHGMLQRFERRLTHVKVLQFCAINEMRNTQSLTSENLDSSSSPRNLRCYAFV